MISTDCVCTGCVVCGALCPRQRVASRSATRRAGDPLPLSHFFVLLLSYTHIIDTLSTVVCPQAAWYAELSVHVNVWQAVARLGELATESHSAAVLTDKTGTLTLNRMSTEVFIYRPRPPFLSCARACDLFSFDRQDWHAHAQPHVDRGVYLQTPPRLYTILPLPILYGVWHTKEGSGKGSCIAQ